MSEQRIILINGSRLLHEMLNRILVKAENLEVVQQVRESNDLPAAIEQQNVEWVVFSLPADDKLPDWVDAYLHKHPSVKILNVPPDGNWIKMKWLDSHEESIVNPSLKELIHILENKPIHIEKEHAEKKV